MKCFQDIYEATAKDGFIGPTLHAIDELVNQIKMDPQTFLDLIYESIQESARQARLSSGRPSSQATLQEALQQVAMLEAAKEAQAIGR